ncbi:MAG: hypothetical protein ACYTBZ_22730 [Planctomycetota bacterium]|jgi:hypothetical protein
MKKVFLITVAVLYVAASPARADIVTVATSGGDYTTIQAAINDCNDGWIVEVADGSWGGSGNRDLDFGGKRITVRSANGPESCTINCGGTSISPHRAFYFHSGEDANSILEGFTIKNGYTNTLMDVQHGGAILCEPSGAEEPSSPTIRNCIITENEATDDNDWGHGGGIYCEASSPTITNCIISLNSARFGGGISCAYPVEVENPKPVPTIINCTIQDNVVVCSDPVSPSYDGYGGGVYCYDSSVVIDNSTIIGNSAFWGGGVCFEYDGVLPPGPQLTITGCTISGNSATYANPDLWDNGWATGGGIAVSALYGGGIISECKITGNLAVHYGGGIDFEGTSSLSIVNCIISGNLVDSGNEDIPGAGGAIACFGASPTVLNCTISSNDAEDYGGQEWDDYGGGGGYIAR